MTDREQILDSVSTASVEDLAEAILKGIVTKEELLNTDPPLAAPKRKQILERVRVLEAEDDSAWSVACASESEFALKQYLSTYPSGRHVNEALQKIEDIAIVNNRLEEERRIILGKLSNDPNAYSKFQINGFLNRGAITKEDIINCGIPSGVINLLNSDGTQFNEKDLGDVPKSIPRGLTEVYFWGTPKSGKTTTLAAILSAGEKNGQIRLKEASSSEYSGKLRNVFFNEFVNLPGPTPVEKTQYLPISLYTPKKSSLLSRVLGDQDKNVEKGIALIELSGEIFECFLKHNSNTPQEPQHQEAFDSLVRFLGSDNKKIHFFIISAEGNQFDEVKGYKTSDYLDAAVTYFENNAIFKKKTDAMYVLVTKSDMLNDNDSICTHEESQQLAESYVKNPNLRFKAFIDILNKYCARYGINGNRDVLVMPFTLGKVYFKNICQFDDRSTLEIIEILHERVKTYDDSIFNK
jgi:hypothetical protein